MCAPGCCLRVRSCSVAPPWTSVEPLAGFPWPSVVRRLLAASMREQAVAVLKLLRREASDRASYFEPLAHELLPVSVRVHHVGISKFRRSNPAMGSRERCSNDVCDAWLTAEAYARAFGIGLRDLRPRFLRRGANRMSGRCLHFRCLCARRSAISGYLSKAARTVLCGDVEVQALAGDADRFASVNGGQQRCTFAFLLVEGDRRSDLRCWTASGG